MADVKLLTGPRVTLRAPRLDAAEELFAAVASDPEVARYMSQRARNETRRVITELFNVGDERNWLIELRDSVEIVGSCGFRQVQAHSRDFGYCLGRRWWGQRIMAEVVHLLLAETASHLVYLISAICHVDNIRSAPALARLAGRWRRLVRHTLPQHQHRAAGCSAVRQGG